ncbi:hypothetical protein FH972_005054 [Carpinus fangiana]|uniref:Uncharacterized protein n=1 Tax=Carpinus fangiana TaxID=176857 RepID=A0A5N6QNF8_9ROSI|nr:hypothetical protein FH972_005054 [Carpinus fangiana]
MKLTNHDALLVVVLERPTRWSVDVRRSRHYARPRRCVCRWKSQKNHSSASVDCLDRKKDQRMRKGLTQILLVNNIELLLEVLPKDFSGSIGNRVGDLGKVVELRILNGGGDDAVGELIVGCHCVSAREQERGGGPTVRELVESEERGMSGGVRANQRVAREEEE